MPTSPPIIDPNPTTMTIKQPQLTPAVGAFHLSKIEKLVRESADRLDGVVSLLVFLNRVSLPEETRNRRAEHARRLGICEEIANKDGNSKAVREMHSNSREQLNALSEDAYLLTQLLEALRAYMEEKKENA